MVGGESVMAIRVAVILVVRFHLVVQVVCVSCQRKATELCSSIIE
jgi:hypothetical protein